MSCFKDCLKPKYRVETEVAGSKPQSSGWCGGRVQPAPTSELYRNTDPNPKSIMDRPTPISTKVIPFAPPVKAHNLDKEFTKISMETGGGVVDTANVAIDVANLATDWWVGSNIPIKVQNFLKKEGNTPIEVMKIGRTPLKSNTTTALNIISSGQFDKIKNKLGYEVFFHLYIIINNKFILEKNEVFNIKPYKPSKEEQTIDVPLDKNLTIGDLLETASVDKANFYGNYDAFGNNCQDMVMRVLTKNGLANSELTKFVKQDFSSLLTELQPLREKVKTITNVGALINKLLQYATRGQRSFACGTGDVVRVRDFNSVRVRQH